MENKISIEVTEEERTTIIDALDTLKQVLQPKLVKLSPDEWNELPRLGKKHHSFVPKSIQYAEQNPELAPSYLDVAEMSMITEQHAA